MDLRKPNTWQRTNRGWQFAAATGLTLALAATTALAAPGGGGGGGKNQAPTCTIDTPAGDQTINVGQSINYTGTAIDSDGTVVSYTWSFGGGTPSASTAEDPGDVTYNQQGTYITSFSATDDKGKVCDAATRTITVGDTPPPQAANYSVVTANDLGMHCMDKEYSVFSILPPFNVLVAQVIEKGYIDAAGNPVLPRLVDDTEVNVTYDAVADGTGSINSTAVGKTDFWDYAQAMFGCNLNLGEGLLACLGVDGLYMPGDAPIPGPQHFEFSTTHDWFEAFGIPITPLDDSGAINPYPMLRVAADDGATTLAQTDVVVPVAQETDCRNCHATGEIAAPDPDPRGITWDMDADTEIEGKRNVLILHDYKHATDLVNSTPVLCAGCHYSPALDLGGQGPQGPQVGNPLMSQAMHNHHGKLTDGAGNPLFPDDAPVDETCYQCHPGKVTQCQRGAMKAGGMVCTECHGGMLAVGGEYPLLAGGSIDGTNDGGTRRPWTDMPRCQSCHTGDAVDNIEGTGYVLNDFDRFGNPDGIRLRQAYKTGDLSASAILASNQRFAENTDNLYRFSKGHGGVFCEGCHGSTHAIWPVTPPSANDNATSTQLQGHDGKVQECDVCHERDANGDLSMPLGLNGPHGMHPVGDLRWNHQHRNFVGGKARNCTGCHGADLTGTVLSVTSADRVLDCKTNQGDFPDCAAGSPTAFVPAGTPIGCGNCHKQK